MAKQNLHVNGFFLINGMGVCLNNAGVETQSNNENAVAVKKIHYNGRNHVYVSGQAWKSWLRKTLYENLGWDMSPVTTEGKIAFTAADPLKYLDDRFFGYMKATKMEVEVEDDGKGKKKGKKADEGEESDDVVTEENGADTKKKTKKVDITVTRKGPFSASILHSVAPITTARWWSSFSARKEGNAVPYVKEESSGIFQGQFSIDIMRSDTFSQIFKAGYRNITEQMAKEYVENQGCKFVDDPYMVNADGPVQLVKAPEGSTYKGICDILNALTIMNGGASQANNMADVTPQFIVLATTTTGNHPWGNIMKVQPVVEPVEEEQEDEPKEMNKKLFNGKPVFHIDAIKEVIDEYKEHIVFPIYIGKRMGFMDEQNAELEKLAEESGGMIVYGPVNKVVKLYCDSLKGKV